MGAPVKNTCPDIDRVIKWVNAAIREAELGVKMEDIEDIDDIKATFKEIMHQLDGVESSLEDLRSANGELRDWGYEQEKKVDELEEEIYELTNR